MTMKTMYVVVLTLAHVLAFGFGQRPKLLRADAHLCESFGWVTCFRITPLAQPVDVGVARMEE